MFVDPVTEQMNHQITDDADLNLFEIAFLTYMNIVFIAPKQVRFFGKLN